MIHVLLMIIDDCVEDGGKDGKVRGVGKWEGKRRGE